MIPKLLAAGAILFSSVCLAELYCKTAREAEERSAALTLLLGAIRDGIERYVETLEEILAEFSSPALDAIGFLCDAREELAQEGSVCGSLRKHRAELFLSEEDEREILGFFSHFGEGSADEEIRRAGELFDRRRDREEKRKAERKNREKICRVLFLSGGVTAILLLL